MRGDPSSIDRGSDVHTGRETAVGGWERGNRLSREVRRHGGRKIGDTAGKSDQNVLGHDAGDEPTVLVGGSGQGQAGLIASSQGSESRGLVISLVDVACKEEIVRNGSCERGYVVFRDNLPNSRASETSIKRPESAPSWSKPRHNTFGEGMRSSIS